MVRSEVSLFFSVKHRLSTEDANQHAGFSPLNSNKLLVGKTQRGWNSYAQWQVKKEARPSFCLQPQAVRVAANSIKHLYVFYPPLPSYPLKVHPQKGGEPSSPVPTWCFRGPGGSSGHEGGVNLCRRSSIKWQRNILGFVKALLSLTCPKQQKSAGLVSLGHKSSQEFSCWIATEVNFPSKGSVQREHLILILPN